MKQAIVECVKMEERIVNDDDGERTVYVATGQNKDEVKVRVSSLEAFEFNIGDSFIVKALETQGKLKP